MPPKITRVKWTASNIPSGLLFNQDTGTFSGTATEAGEYTVPVTVETNYGTDTKDVYFEVEGRAYPVYAVGSKASTWSGNAEADEDGFRKLDMPDAYKLLEHGGGFGAKTANGKYYCCGINKFKTSNAGEISTVLSYANTPEELTVSGVSSSENIDEVRIVYLKSYTWTATSTNPLKKNEQTYEGYCMLVRYGGRKLVAIGSDVRLNYNYQASSISNTTWMRGNSQSIAEIFRLPEAYAPTTDIKGGTHFLMNGGSEDWKIYFDTDDSYKSWLAVKYADMDYKATRLYLPYEYEVSGTNTGGCSNRKAVFGYLSDACYLNNDANNFTLGTIRDAWVYMTQCYAVTTDKKVYSKKGTGSWSFQGEYDVKKMLLPSSSLAFMLTKDGELYHKGSAVSGVTDAHTEFTRIYEGSEFHDIAYNNKTLTVLKEG